MGFQGLVMGDGCHIRVIVVWKYHVLASCPLLVALCIRLYTFVRACVRMKLMCLTTQFWHMMVYDMTSQQLSGQDQFSLNSTPLYRVSTLLQSRLTM